MAEKAYFPVKSLVVSSFIRTFAPVLAFGLHLRFLAKTDSRRVSTCFWGTKKTFGK
jgi:hypothetical protein